MLICDYFEVKLWCFVMFFEFQVRKNLIIDDMCLQNIFFWYQWLFFVLFVIEVNVNFFVFVYQICIGIYFGLVMVGVVGKMMFCYCLFGSIVILVNKMELGSKLGFINVSCEMKWLEEKIYFLVLCFLFFKY